MDLIGPVRQDHPLWLLLVESGGTSTTARYGDSGDNFDLWKDIELMDAAAEKIAEQRILFLKKDSRVLVLHASLLEAFLS